MAVFAEARNPRTTPRWVPPLLLDDGVNTADDLGSVGICAHGNVLGLLLNHLDPGYGREDADRTSNPDVVKLTTRESQLVWDPEFRLPGLDQIATNHRDSPIDW